MITNWATMGGNLFHFGVVKVTPLCIRAGLDHLSVNIFSGNKMLYSRDPDVHPSVVGTLEVISADFR